MAAFKRKLFYLSGFDPRGARHYHALHAEAAARRAALTGERHEVGPRRRAGAHVAAWDARADDAETECEFLEWDDLVRRAWTRDPFRLLIGAARAYWGQFRRGDRALVARLPRGPVIAFWLPGAAAVLLPALVGLPIFLLALARLRWPWALAVGAAAGLVLAAALLRRARAAWMLRFVAFNARSGGGEGDPGVAARLDLFADRVAAALAEPWDEVLLVTHSNGSVLAVPLLARLLERGGGVLPDRFTLVTLGQCIPLALARTDNPRFRERLAEVARGHFHWLDVGSPADGAAFHAVDPTALVGLDRRFHLEQLSPRFHLFYEPANYHRGWRNKYEIHFDYLRVGDRPSPLDYPALVGSARPVDEAVDAFRRIP